MTNPNQESEKLNQPQELTQLIDTIIDQNLGSLSSIARENEQSLVMDVPMTFSDCPTATRILVERPTPGQEQEAAAKWKVFGGHRISVIESGGKIQTDFLVHGDEVLRRQHVSMPGSMEPLGNESNADFHNRRSSELLGDALSLIALDGAQRAVELKRSNVGESADPAVVTKLIAWVRQAQPANI